jgi:hypothetical protein
MLLRVTGVKAHAEYRFSWQRASKCHRCESACKVKFVSGLGGEGLCFGTTVFRIPVMGGSITVSKILAASRYP